MAINLVQFQAGLSMAEFQRQYGTEAQCAAALEAMRWPGGFRCPDCGSSDHTVFERAGWKYWQCSGCRCQTTVVAGTIFQATTLPLTRWFLAMHLLTQAKNNVAALELKRHLGVCYRTAWRVKHKLLQVMVEREADRVLEGRVEIDDAYLGGEHPGKPGRGSENKVPFVIAVQTSEEGHPLLMKATPLPFTQEALGVGRSFAVGFGHGGIGRLERVLRCAKPGRLSSPDRRRFRAAGGSAPGVSLGQHRPRESQDGDSRHLPCVPFPEVRGPVSG